MLPWLLTQLPWGRGLWTALKLCPYFKLLWGAAGWAFSPSLWPLGGRVKNGGTLRMLRVPDRRLGGQGYPPIKVLDRIHGWQSHFWHHEWPSFTPRKVPWKFCVDISIGSVSGRGGQEGVYLEDVEGTWPETWMTGSFLISWMMLFYPKNYTLKISC